MHTKIKTWHNSCGLGRCTIKLGEPAVPTELDLLVANTEVANIDFSQSNYYCSDEYLVRDVQFNYLASLQSEKLSSGELLPVDFSPYQDQEVYLEANTDSKLAFLMRADGEMPIVYNCSNVSVSVANTSEAFLFINAPTRINNTEYSMLRQYSIPAEMIASGQLDVQSNSDFILTIFS